MPAGEEEISVIPSLSMASKGTAKMLLFFLLQGGNNRTRTLLLLQLSIYVIICFGTFEIQRT